LPGGEDVHALIRLVAVTVACVLVSSAQAALPAIPEIPSSLPEPARAALTPKLVALTQRQEASIAKGEALKQHCTGLEKGSPAHRECLSQKTAFDKEVADLREDVRAFEAEIQAAMPAAVKKSRSEDQSLRSSRILVSPGSIPFDRSIAPIEKTFDSRTEITFDDFASARLRLKTSIARQQLLEGQLSRVLKIKRDLHGDIREFDAMREEASKDLAFEILDHVPVGDMLKPLSEARMALDTKRKIETAWEALKFLAKTGSAISEPDEKKAADAVIEGNRAAVKAMMLPLGVDDKTRKLLESIQKVLESGSKVAIAISNDIDGQVRKRAVSEEERKRQVRETVGNLFVTVGEVCVPIAGVPVMATHLYLRNAQRQYAEEALEAIDQGISRTWDAERFFRTRIATEEIEISAGREIITKYCSLRSSSASCRS
jgi:hypothetical protein